VKISELSIGEHDLVISSRKGREIRAKGKVVEAKQGKCFIVRRSPKRSFGPGTQVLRRRKGQEHKINQKRRSHDNKSFL